MSEIATMVGKRLRNYRQSMGFSQEKLADSAGLHPTYIGQVERGEKNLTIESLQKITNALNISMADVFEKAEDRAESNNYAMKAYELISSKKPSERETYYRILEDIEKLSTKK